MFVFLLERFLYTYFVIRSMTRTSTVVLLLVLTLFLVACAKTEVIQQPSETPSTNETQAEEPTPAPAPGEVVATKCDDTDLNDPNSIGRVRVSYSDGSNKDFYDICNDIILTEYVCNGNNVKTMNVICKKQCLNTNVQDKSCVGCKVGSCFEFS